MLEALHYPFFIRALLAGALVGAMCGGLGVVALLKRLAFFGEGVGHASLLGIALALMFGMSPLFGALCIAIFFSLLLSQTVHYTKIKEDVALGILFSTLMAFGIVLLSQTKTQGADLTSLLFGSILTVTHADLWIGGGIAAIILAAGFLLYNPLKVIVFDQSFAGQLGLPVTLLSNILLVLLSLGIVSGIKLVGVVMVSSLLVAPASIALKISTSFSQAVMFGALIGVAVAESGIVLSFYLDTPPGATIVIVAGGLFFLTYACIGFLKKDNS